jgi:hypothetical protein
LISYEISKCKRWYVANSETAESSQVTSRDGNVVEKVISTWLNKKFANFTEREIALNPVVGPCFVLN